ncbi:hypothetical protein H4R33_006506 [Dimargaris cristalligena]|uniref:Uncharacterized protein n=1 Tax=Dimargaris cristalligena TaxID=215637 RepID=A0A4P9ZN97_9FUNG|nr:hypothetical protein H4R33_006506 [Dimargaris cristalligena]RKP34635.1 hypothetical protein BJ085DRAFT_40843 [Dimargaris cristalligena]|eukprot:RKP34635.1 hypothetical protein BJ085DRAFT_40843 [Dimargaris cristalligena]
MRTVWRWDLTGLQRVLNRAHGDTTLARKQILLDRYLLAKRDNLHALTAEWDYIDYTRLTHAQCRVVFPLIYALSNFPADLMMLIYERFSAVTWDYPRIIAAADRYQDPLTRAHVKMFQTIEWNPLYSNLVTEFLVSVGATLAVTGQIAKLMHLVNHSSSPHIPVDSKVQQFLAVVVLEYGGLESREWAIAHAGPESAAKGMAQRQGFQQAFQSFPADLPIRELPWPYDPGEPSAHRHVHLYRDSNGSPRLAIRVRKSTTLELLREAGLPAEESVWLPRNTVHSILESVQMTIPDWLLE